MSIFRSEQIEQPVNFSGSFTGSLLGTASWAENIDTGSLVTTSSFNTFTSSYYIDSASFDYRIENIIINTGSYGTPPVTVNVATTAVLPRSPLYNNGPLNDGVNAFLSASISGTLGNIDGVNVVRGDHILVKNQSNSIQNGVYNVISTGSASGYYILSRSLSSDETSELDSQIVIPSFGTTNKGGIFAQTTDNPIIGTDNIVYTQQTNTLVTQTSAGTQAVYQLPWYTTSTRQLSKGSKNFRYINVTVGTTVTTSSLQLTGSFNISGSIISTGGITGSLSGTSSFATTASYVLNAISSSYAATASVAPNYVLNSNTSSFVTNSQTSSFVTNSQTSSFVLNSQTSSMSVCKIQLACSDETTALTAGTAKITFRMPHAMTVTAVRASLTTAQASGNIFTVDINEGGTSILSTKLTIDNTELTSTTAATPPVISDSSLADDAEITVDIDQIGNGTAKGLKITLIGTY